MLKAKRSLSLVLTILMMISLMACVVLPSSAMTIADVDEVKNNPITKTDTVTTADRVAAYADLNAKTTVLTVDDSGQVTLADNSTYEVPEEFRDKTIRLPGERVLFWDNDWVPADLGVSAVGDYFFAEYGDGETWGNGDVYMLQWGVNAFGKTSLTDSTDVSSGATLSAAGARTGWTDALQIIRHSTPVVGANNNWYVLLFPSKITASTGASGTTAEVTHKIAETSNVKELTKADYTNVHFYGPQAGVSPTSGVVGDATLMNDRGTDASKEAVFTATFWMPHNAVWYFDGITMSGANKVHAANASSNAVSALYIENMYVDLQHDAVGEVWSTVGSNNTNSGTLPTNCVARVYHLKNVYFEHNATSVVTSINYLQANDLLFDNVVMKDITCDSSGGAWRILPSKFSCTDTAFLGDYRNEFHAEIRNSTFKNHHIRESFGLFNNAFTEYTGDAVLKFDNNYAEYGNKVGESYFLKLYTTTKTGASDPKIGVSIDVTDNYFLLNEDVIASAVVRTFQMQGGYFSGNHGATFSGNTFVATPGAKALTDVYSSNELIDISGNLFLTHDGYIRAGRASYISNNYTGNVKTLSDTYLSNEMAGGIRENFTVMETTQDLLVLYSFVQTFTLNTDPGLANATALRGVVTILPEYGKTYSTKDLFVYNNDKVEFLGVYNDVGCTTAVDSFQKGFGTLYAKAQYKTDKTTCIVVYEIKEPNEYQIVDPGNVGSYTFNGTTYTEETEKTTFHTSLSNAFAFNTFAAFCSEDLNYFPANLDDVILLMPGTYSEGVVFDESCAIVGPGFGKDPTSATSTEIQNGRGTASLEAVRDTSYTSIDADKTSYVTVAGLTLSRASSATITVERGKVQKSLTFINLSNHIVNGGYFTYAANGTDYLDNAIVNANNIYFTQGTGAQAIQGTYLRYTLKNSVFNDIAYTTGLAYINVPVPTNMSFMPRSAQFIMEGCQVYNYSKYGINTAWRNYADTDKYVDGVQLLVDNCLFENYGADIVRPQPGIANTGVVKVTNCKVTRATQSDASVFSHYVAVAAAGKFKEYTVENNILINCTRPFHLNTLNNSNVDQNYFGNSNGRVIKLDTTLGTGYTKSDWYYVDEKMTTKNTEVYLADNGYASFSNDAFDGLNNATVKIDGNTVSFKAINGAEVVGVYTDEDCTDEFSGTVDYSKTLYVLVKNTSTGVSYPTKVTVSAPCLHVSGVVPGTKVDATCGSDGYQEYNCSLCGEPMEDKTEVYYATGNHAWDTGVESLAPTCYSKGETTYTCTNEICKADGTKATKTEPIDMISHTAPTDWTTTIAPTCQTEGEKEKRCTVAACNALIDSDSIPVVNCATADPSVWTETTAATCEADGEEKQFCQWCTKELAKRSIPMLGHDWDEGVEDPKANCKDDGLLVQTCKNDSNHKKETPIPSTGEHGFVATVVTPATCTTAGKMNYYCDGCKVSHDEDIPMLGHDYAATVDKEATCTEDGIMLYICGNCEDDYEEPIPSNGKHVYVGTVTTDATCNTTGVMTYDCGNCDAFYTETIPATGNHDYAAVVTTEASCTEDGEMTYTCKKEDCKFVKTEVIPNKGGHQFGTWTLGKNSTCSVAGYDYRVCMVCGETETRDRELIDHVWEDEFTVDTKPTGTVKGEKSIHCKLCDARTQVTDMGYCVHENAANEWEIDREPTCVELGIMHQVCDLCGDDFNKDTDIDMVPHQLTQTGVIDEATCTTDGLMGTYCSICNLNYTERIPMLGHTEGVWKTVTVATCTEDGKAEKYCVTCGELMGSKTIAATNHACGYKWVVTDEATCFTPGAEDYTCKECGHVATHRVIPMLGHQDVHVDTIPATCTEDGSRTYVCLICDAPLDEVIPATGHTAGKWEIIKIATTLAHGERVKKCITCGEIVEHDYIEQIVSSGNPFVDVPNNAWYKKAVDFVYGSGIMNGVDATHFAPDASTSRGMFVTILGRLSGVDASKYTYAYFEDVKDDSYYFGYIEWARVNGIVNGTGNYVFEPDRAITRQEMCKIIVGYADYENIDLELTKAKVTFKDDAKIASWAKSFVYTCQRSSVISGDTNGSFRPTDTAKRSEVATLIMNFYSNNMK